MNNKELLKKKILYRSTHRGNKEMDLLLGGFVKKNIDLFDESDLRDLEKLLLLSDEKIQNWYFKKIKHESLPENNVSRLLKKFKI